MTDFVGMDTAAVQQLGTNLKAISDSLHRVVVEIDRMMHQTSGIWEGHDANDFRQWWSGQHRPGLLGAVSSIAGLGQSAVNNAREQEHASSGGASPVGSVATAVGSVAGTAVAASGPAESSGAAAKTAAFASKWNGKYLDYDGKYGNQCYDVFSQYNHDVVGGPDIHAGVTGGARDIYEQYANNGAAAHYTRIPVSGGHPQVGDVVVWGATDSNKYGHVGIVTSVSDSGYTTLEQNTDGRASSTTSGAVTHTVSHSYDSKVPLGYLRPTVSV